MTRYEILSFLNSTSDATAENVAEYFSMPRSYVYSRLTVLNRQGLITKRKGEDGVLHFGLTNWGRDKLDWLEGQEENLEVNKKTGGNNTMPKTPFLEDGVYECPSCGRKYELEDAIPDSDDELCDGCGEELDFVEPFEDDEDEPVRRKGR